MRRNKRKEGLMKRIMKGLFNRKTLKNKIYSLALILVGYISIHLLDGDATAFIVSLMLGIPVFFSKENVIM